MSSEGQYFVRIRGAGMADAIEVSSSDGDPTAASVVRAVRERFRKD